MDNIYHISSESNFRSKSRQNVFIDYQPRKLELSDNYIGFIQELLQNNNCKRIVFLSDTMNNPLEGYLPKDMRFIVKKTLIHTYSSAEKFKDEFYDDISTCYIIENLGKLKDPRPLLKSLRALLKRNQDNTLIILNAEDTEKRNPHTTEYRCWQKDELKDFLHCSGFMIQDIKTDNKNSLSFFSLKCSTEYYEKFLINNNFPKPSRFLTITTEHADCKETGGIGSYLKYTSDVFEDRLILIINLTSSFKSSLSIVNDRKWFHLGLWHHDEPTTNHNFHEIILEAVNSIIYLYDEIEIIEFQDFYGIAYRVAQAAKAGLFPKKVATLCIAHGNHCYLDNAAQHYGDYDAKLSIFERQSVDLADYTIYPTQFIFDLYKNQLGINVKNTMIAPFPIKTDTTTITSDYKDISTLIFFGKQTEQKGYNDFINTLFELSQNNDVWQKIKKIILIGVNHPDENIFKFGKHIEFGVFPSEKAIDLIKQHTNNGLVILPYKGDNYPMSIFEVVNTKCQILVKNAGGCAEVIPNKLHKDLLYGGSLTNAIIKALATQNRHQLIEDTQEAFHEAYHTRLEYFKTTLQNIKSPRDKLPKAKDTSVGIFISNFKGNKQYLNELYDGIMCQTVMPNEIVIVDDCSPEEYKQNIIDLYHKLNKNIPTKLIIQAENYGLSVTRNTGIANIETDYILIHDNDNIMESMNIEVMKNALDSSDDISCVTSFSKKFNDNVDLHAINNFEDYKPSGGDVAFVLTNGLPNIFGDAHAMLRRAENNLYDTTTRAKWEDFQLFMDMNLSGKLVLPIPQALFYYRNRADSMQRSYNDFEAYQRIERTLVKHNIKSANLLVKKREEKESNIFDYAISAEHSKKILSSRGRTFIHLLELMFSIKKRKKYKSNQ